MSDTAKRFMSKRMHNWKEGEMHSRVRGTGPVVQKQGQAVAISMSEMRKKGMKVPPEK